MRQSIVREGRQPYKGGFPTSPSTSKAFLPGFASRIRQTTRPRALQQIVATRNELIGIEAKRADGVTGASIVATIIPITPGSPVAPGFVVVHLAMGISRFNRRAIAAPGVVAGVSCHVPSQRGSCKQRSKGCGRANQSEFRHALSPFGSGNADDQMRQRSRVPTLVPKKNLVPKRELSVQRAAAAAHKPSRWVDAD